SALPSPHDGTVAVEETRLEGATEHIVLPVSHLSMLWSGVVAEQVVNFLSSGRFRLSSESP
ncbi:MAG: alpha/beta hydrolase, partial [Gammaproteobacteria bacterium]|nr:alpha/beta hydrolase [Gammaproteobacteria bacterium]